MDVYVYRYVYIYVMSCQVRSCNVMSRRVMYTYILGIYLYVIYSESLYPSTYHYISIHYIYIWTFPRSRTPHSCHFRRWKSRNSRRSSGSFSTPFTWKWWKIRFYGIYMDLPSGKRLHNYAKSPFLMGKSSISMAIFNSYVSHYQRVSLSVGFNP